MKNCRKRTAKAKSAGMTKGGAASDRIDRSGLLSLRSQVPARQTLVAALICVAAAIASLAPFATKAFHTDDTLFLYAARQICAHPADPYGFNVNWYGTAMGMADVTQNGPLASYYIALVASCAGWSELALHLAFLVPAAAAVLGTYFLAVRFCTRPLLAAMTTLLCPVFMISSTTVMCDTMMLALWAWAVVLWLWGVEGKSHLLLIVSAGLIVAAAVTKYFAVALIPLLLADSLLRWPRIRWRVLYLVIPVAVLLAYDSAMRSLYGHSVLYGASSYAWALSGKGGYLPGGLTTLCFMGGCLATVVFYAPLLWSRRVVAVGVLGAELMAGLLYFAGSLGDFALPGDGGARLLMVLQFSVFVVAGVGLLALAVADLWRSRDTDSTLLVLWVAGTFVFCWILNWTINGRSILPMVPAVSILIARRIRPYRSDSSGRSFPWHYVPLVGVGILAMAVTWVDTRLANTARIAAAEIDHRYGERKDTVWFAGHWGFQYYMESYGFQPLDDQKPRLAPGGILILPVNNTNVPAPPTGMFVHTATLERVSSPLLATMHPAVGAGFYTSAWGPLPFAVGSVPAERYYVATLSPTAEADSRINPDDVEAQNNRAWRLATREPAQGGNPAEAVSLAQQACKLTDNKSPGCLDTLAAAHASADRFPEAIAAAERAMELAAAAGQTSLATWIEGRLRLYRENRTYREPAEPLAPPGP